MKVIVKKDKLIKALQKVQGVIEKRTTLPILNNILFETDSNLTIKATNLEVSIIVKVDANIIDNGSLCVPAKKIFEIVRLLPENEVTIEQIDKNILISNGKINYKLFTYPTEDFPAIKTINKTHEISIDREKFFESIKKVEYTIYPDESRESLNGVFMHKVDNKLRFVASDSFRLAYNEFIFEKECEDILIPKKTVNELTKIQSDIEEKEINLYIEDKTVMVELGNATLISKLKEAKFPNYKEVIPNNPYKLYLDKNAILDTLRRVSIISDETTRSVILNIDEDKLVIKSSNAELGFAEEEMPAKFEGVPFEICFNAKFLIEAIESIYSETIIMDLKDGQSAAMLSGDESYKAVLMPIRM